MIFRETDLFYDEQLDLIMREMEVARSVASKIAYQWFSNVFGSSWWSHIWLHDGLAFLFAEKATVKVSTFISYQSISDLKFYIIFNFLKFK